MSTSAKNNLGFIFESSCYYLQSDSLRQQFRIANMAKRVNFEPFFPSALAFFSKRFSRSAGLNDGWQIGSFQAHEILPEAIVGSAEIALHDLGIIRYQSGENYGIS